MFCKDQRIHYMYVYVFCTYILKVIIFSIIKEANRNGSFIKERDKHLELIKKLRQSIENKDSEIRQLTTLNIEQKSVINTTETRMNSMKELIDTVVNEVADLKSL